MAVTKRPARIHAVTYRSGLEDEVAKQLRHNGVEYAYEQYVVPYTKPTKEHRYTPDFVLPNGIVIETKGIWDTADRQKHKLVAAQHPDLDIRFVFSRSTAKIGKKSKTTYAMYCEANGWQYADRLVPEAWLKERPKKARVDAIRRLIRRYGGDV